ncbi:hypothetical protein NE237_030009 [Protea cynaroides]|uniref:Uncharacterized protein n=1 Tax=Protea cynaroides TaxID=273540 RepID=A0A9Q0JVM4_9MAGN|nr:hypothetical protein NE237_030009 [Protea cynaroides]
MSPLGIGISLDSKFFVGFLNLLEAFFPPEAMTVLTLALLLPHSCSHTFQNYCSACGRDVSEDYSCDETVASVFDWITICKMKLQNEVISDKELEARPRPRGTMATRAVGAVDARGRQEEHVEMEMEVPPTVGGGSIVGPSMHQFLLLP